MGNNVCGSVPTAETIHESTRNDTKIITFLCQIPELVDFDAHALRRISLEVSPQDENQSQHSHDDDNVKSVLAQERRCEKLEQYKYRQEYQRALKGIAASNKAYDQRLRLHRR